MIASRLLRCCLVIYIQSFACAKKKVTPAKTLVVGGLVPITGTNADSYWVDTLSMAVDDMNQALSESPASKDIQFKLASADNGNQPANAPELAQQMKAQGALTLFCDASNVTGVLNGLNYATPPLGIPIVAAPVTDKNFGNPKTAATYMASLGISPAPSIDPAAWLQGYTDPGNWMYRTATSGDTVGVQQREMYSRGANADGDIDGNGIVKVVYFSSTNPCNSGTNLKFLKTNANYRCEWVPAPVPTSNPADFDWNAAVKQMFDDSNSTPVTDPNTNVNTLFSAALVTAYGVTPYAASFDPINCAASTSTNCDLVSPLADDGPPDFIFDTLFPAFNGPFMTAYINGGYAASFPNVKIETNNSFVRASVIELTGANADGVEGAISLRAARSASGTYFQKAFTDREGVQLETFDSAIYDSMAIAMLGALKAALPLPDPTKVTPAQVRAVLGQLGPVPLCSTDADCLAASARTACLPDAAPATTSHCSDPKNPTAAAPVVVSAGPDGFKTAIATLAAGGDVDYDGASGPVDFDAFGNVQSDYEFYSVQKGQFTTEKIFDCLSDAKNCPAIAP